MPAKNYATTILVDQTPEEVFNAVNNVRGWWIDKIEGNSEKLNDEFAVRFGDVHYSKQKLVESVPGKKIVWLVTDSKLNFIKEKDEWTGTKVIFEISGKGGKTQMQFTHEGLTPAGECYDACSNAWSDYVISLKNLITTGKGKPTHI